LSKYLAANKAGVGGMAQKIVDKTGGGPVQTTFSPITKPPEVQSSVDLSNEESVNRAADSLAATFDINAPKNEIAQQVTNAATTATTDAARTAAIAAGNQGALRQAFAGDGVRRGIGNMSAFGVARDENAQNLFRESANRAQDRVKAVNEGAKSANLSVDDSAKAFADAQANLKKYIKDTAAPSLLKDRLRDVQHTVTGQGFDNAVAAGGQLSPEEIASLRGAVNSEWIKRGNIKPSGHGDVGKQYSEILNANQLSDEDYARLVSGFNAAAGQKFYKAGLTPTVRKAGDKLTPQLAALQKLMGAEAPDMSDAALLTASGATGRAESFDTEGYKKALRDYIIGSRVNELGLGPTAGAPEPIKAATPKTGDKRKTGSSGGPVQRLKHNV
jgi:hypothetical protein